jgi:hypothetical protein
MYFIAITILLFVSKPAISACFPVLDNNHPCRYWQGDSWCEKKGRAPYAYADKCMRSHAPPTYTNQEVYVPPVINQSSSQVTSIKTVTLVNRTGEDIIWGYITPGGQSGWGADQLGNNKIPANGQHIWNINHWTSCYVDIKVKTASGRDAEQLGVNACGGYIWTLY